MIRTRQPPAPSHEPHHLPGALDPPSAQRGFASCVSHAPPPRFCFRFNWWCYHVGIVQKDHELPSFCLITFINLFWFMQCHVDAAKASRWLMINEVFKPRTSEHQSNLSTNLWWAIGHVEWDRVGALTGAIPSKKMRPLWFTMNHSYPNKLSDAHFEPYPGYPQRIW